MKIDTYMKKEFLYEQYNQIDWSKQEETEVNFPVNEFIIDYTLSKHDSKSISLFDIGFGIGFFLRMFAKEAKTKYETVHIEGCEPSSNSYKHFEDKTIEGIELVTYPVTFLDVKTSASFDFVTAVYVLPHILFEDLESAVQKIHSMLKPGGRFIGVITSEQSFKTVEKNDKDLFNIVEENTLAYKGKEYAEILHKSLIPDIGYVYDYNRDESLYVDMFSKNGFVLEKQRELDDGYFLHSILVFQKAHE